MGSNVGSASYQLCYLKHTTLTSLSFRFLIYEMGITIAPTATSGCEVQKAFCIVLDINLGSIRSAIYINVYSSTWREFLKSKNERGVQISQAGSFAFSAHPFPSCNQEGRQDSACTQPLCPLHCKTTSGYRVGNFIFHRNQTFAFQPV